MTILSLPSTRLLSIFSLIISVSFSSCVSVIVDESDAGKTEQATREETKGSPRAEMETAPDLLPVLDMFLSPSPLDQALDQPSPDMEETHRVDCGTLTECNGRCVDITSDVFHCGACLQHCVIHRGQGLCRNGNCEILSCDPNYYDYDQNPSNGCETLDNCIPNQSCLTSCQSNGISLCRGGISECIPPDEACTLQDDDCDGRCDEEATNLNCKIAVHRGYANGFHLYSTSSSLISSQGFGIEQMGYFELYQDSLPNTVAVYLCLDSMARATLSTTRNCGNGLPPLEQLGYWSTEAVCGARPLYSLTQPESGNTFYTIDLNEVNFAMRMWSYQNQGIVGYVW